MNQERRNATSRITIKRYIIYYGPHSSGKSSNLYFIQKSIAGAGPLLSYDTEHGRHPFFDLPEIPVQVKGYEAGYVFTVLTTAGKPFSDEAYSDSLSLVLEQPQGSFLSRILNLVASMKILRVGINCKRH